MRDKLYNNFRMNKYILKSHNLTEITYHLSITPSNSRFQEAMNFRFVSTCVTFTQGQHHSHLLVFLPKIKIYVISRSDPSSESILV